MTFRFNERGGLVMLKDDARKHRYRNMVDSFERGDSVSEIGRRYGFKPSEASRIIQRELEKLRRRQGATDGEMRANAERKRREAEEKKRRLLSF